mgnify:CR=1 FL=1
MRDGVAVVKDYFSDEQCDEFKKEFHSLESDYGNKHNLKGVYSTQPESDVRIFGIEKISKYIKKNFFEDAFFRKIGECYVGEKLSLTTTMAANISAVDGLGIGSGAGWHRDSYSRQFKAIVYLTDVNKKNGPFQYIPRSHLIKNILKVNFKLKRKVPAINPRYTKEEMVEAASLINSDVKSFIATKGTVILADTRGIHGGKPIKEGERSAITNYYVSLP